MQLLAESIYNLYTNLLIVGYDIQTCIVVIYQNGELVTVASALLTDTVVVGVATQHQIYTRLVQNRNEQTLELVAAIPALTLLEGNVQHSNLNGSCTDILALDSLLEPRCQLLTISVVGCSTTILQIAVGFILTAIKHDKGYRALTEGKAGCTRIGGEQIKILAKAGATSLVVTTNIY